MLNVIGIGPGSQAMMTMEAVEALQAAEIVVGYKTYTHTGKSLYRRQAGDQNRHVQRD